MDRDEILRYVSLGRAKSVTVDKSLLDIYPNYIREVTIKQNFIVRLEFYWYEEEDCGITYYFEYDDLDSLIISLEQFLCKTRRFHHQTKTWAVLKSQKWNRTANKSLRKDP